MFNALLIAAAIAIALVIAFAPEYGDGTSALDSRCAQSADRLLPKTRTDKEYRDMVGLCKAFHTTNAK